MSAAATVKCKRWKRENTSNINAIYIVHVWIRENIIWIIYIVVDFKVIDISIVNLQSDRKSIGNQIDCVIKTSKHRST